MEVTQQAASKVVAEMEAMGILEVAPTKDRRAKRIRLSRRAWRAVRLGRLARQRIEKQLIKATGEESYETAKSILVECLQTLGGVERIQSRRVRPPG
jgi:DNA-binding MarR family transcriptional regulator